MLRYVHLRNTYRARLVELLTVGLLAWVGTALNSAMGADAAFVGVLSIAVQDDVAKTLGLSPEVHRQLIEIVDRRENDALELALQIKELGPAERTARLAPFVAESERLGLALLTPEQMQKLQQIRVQRGGMAMLAEETLADRLGLAADQRAQVRKLLDQRAVDLTKGGEQDRRLTNAKYERELAAVLNKQQKGTWEELAGLAMGEPTAEAPAEAPAEVARDTKPAAPPSRSSRFGRPDQNSPTAKPNAVPEPNQKALAAATEGETKLRFAFRYAPWKDVLDWFATQANLSLVLDAPPPGTFNYTDSRAYSPTEAIDLLNSVLLTKGYTLVRRERMLMVFNLEDEIPEPLVELVLPEDLESRGKYELVKCLFPLKKMTPEDAEKELSKLIGPAGKVSVLPQAKQIMVRETAAKLRAIRDIIDAVENPDAKKEEKLAVIKLQHMLPDDFLTTARPLLGLPEGLNSSPDGSLRISIDAVGGRLLIAGRAERVQKLEEIQKLLDVENGTKTPLAAIETPQLEIYRVAGTDPAAVLQVMQTLMTGLPDVRLATDPKTGNLIAMARPSQHATIRETLKQMQRDASEVEVITLRRVDPQTAVVAVNRLFGGDEKGGAANAPKVDADTVTRKLFLRGTPSQMQQVRSLLEKMGEGDAAVAAAQAEQGNVRILPMTGRAARTVLDQAEFLWPTLHKNRIRVVTPSTPAGPSVRRPSATPKEKEEDAEAAKTPPTNRSSKAAAVNGDSTLARVVMLDQSAKEALLASKQWHTNSANKATANKIQFAAYDPAPKGDEKKNDGAKNDSAKKSEPLPEIIVSFGPAGIVIASEDKEALNDFETLLKTLADRVMVSGKEYTVFYLKYAKADAAAALLHDVIGASVGTPTGGGGGGGNLLGDLATNMLGDVGGGLLGGLLGGGGGGGAPVASGTVSIVPDIRLNALIAHASSADLDMVEQLLKVIDQESGPEEVQTAGKPRFIPVFNTSAEEIATVVRQVYSGRIAADAAQAAQRQPSPEEFIRALRGGGGGGRGGQGQQQNKGEPAKMTLGIDARSNSLIVSAPDPLFQEVKTLVVQLDHAAETNQDQSMKVVTIKQANPQLIQRAVTAMVGSQVKTNTISRPAGGIMGMAQGLGLGGQQQGDGGYQPQSDQNPEQMRQRMDFFNEIQRQGGNNGGRGNGGGGVDADEDQGVAAAVDKF